MYNRRNAMSHFTEILSVLKDVALLAAAIVASITAILGWHAWRRDLVVKDAREVARTLLRATFDLRDAIAACRTNTYSSQEFPGGLEPDANKMSLDEKKKAWQHFFQNRWLPVANFRQEFCHAAREAEILWGRESLDKTDRLLGLVQELDCAISYHLQCKEYDQSVRPDSPYRSTIYSSGGDADEFAQNVAAAVADIDAYARPRLVAAQP
ncbi:MAG: hypothetical protein MPK62_07595 [Alphaproteobacteria bacterium]|nr:hypothetical protein [Alphaproteobacteria bacterium]